MEVPKHDVTQFDETGDIDLLNELSKTHLIGASNLLTGHTREDEDGNELALQDYNNTMQKDELRKLVRLVHNLRTFVQDSDEYEWEDVQENGFPPEDEDDEAEDEAEDEDDEDDEGDE